MRLLLWQTIYLATAVVISPISPLLFLQGQYTRRKIGLLPEAGGEKFGATGEGDLPPVKLLVLGESTVAGLGARTHDVALAGRFAEELSGRIRRRVEWTVVGRNGVTAKRTIDELLPMVPDVRFDYILVGLGGNDVMKLSSPRKWRRDMTRLLTILRDRNPDATVFITNCPMIKYSPALPHPIKFLLWELSKMHDANIREFTAGMQGVCYYHQPAGIRLEGFFADGIHPSEQGYADWSAAMMRFFEEEYEW
jgi:lysophospholipase L1-like esterase